MLRILNYVSEKLRDLNDDFDIKLLDLRLENLPEFIPEDLDEYSSELNKLLFSTYINYPFDFVALSCYGSGCYLNTLVVANQIKREIGKNIIITVGGPHPTIYPQDFQPDHIPKDFLLKEDCTPIDFLIQGEGELPLFNLINELINAKRKFPERFNHSCIILEKDFLSNLDDLPIIDFTLFNKYKQHYLAAEALYLEFSRGCTHKCHFCINSSREQLEKTVRTKSITKMFQELSILKKEGWQKVHISDVIFLPDKELRKQFFNELKEHPNLLPSHMSISERIDFCSKEDLEIFGKYNIIPRFGLETVSSTLLKRINKTMMEPTEYLKRFLELVLLSNKIGLKAEFNYIINLPGTDLTCLKEMQNFLDNDADPLIERYFINLVFRIFYSVPNTYLYNNAEADFGTVFTKDWWRMVNKNQKLYSHLVQPSKEITLKDSFGNHFNLIKKFIRAQQKFEQSIHSNETIFYLWGNIKRIIDLSK